MFKGERERVLYVGKATNLSSRVRSYFASTHDREMVPLLVRDARSVDCIATPTPSDALVLERQLIRKHRPRYNSMLKDDKSYPLIALTTDEHPRILYTRNPPAEARVWGPFPDAGAAKRLIQLIRREFGVRDCPELLPQGCLSMHIGLCHGPCIQPDGYSKKVQAATAVLDGDASVIRERIIKEMEEAASELAFEVAADRRDLIARIERMLSQKVVSSRFYQDTDAVGFAERGDLATVTVVQAIDGIIQGKQDYSMIHRGDIVETVQRALDVHYMAQHPPKRLLVPTPLDQDFIDQLRAAARVSFEIRVPQRGDLATLRSLADQNAKIHLQRSRNPVKGSIEAKAAADLAEVLGIETVQTLVCFDMAQIQGDHRVGGMVVFQNGRPEKRSYRTYKVKGRATDDLRMMAEVVERWLKRQSSWPDVMLLDGGATHLATIHTLLEGHGLSDRFLLCAIAKREEVLHRLDNDPWHIDSSGRLLVAARDEAHRFVNTFHRKQRARASLKDPLETIPGLGAKRLQTLLRHLGGLKGIQAASKDQITRVPTIGPTLAERIYTTLHPRDV